MSGNPIFYELTHTAVHGVAHTGIHIVQGKSVPVQDLIVNRVDGYPAYSEATAESERSHYQAFWEHGACESLHYWGDHVWIHLDWKQASNGEFYTPSIRFPEWIPASIALYERVKKAVVGRDNRIAQWDSPEGVLAGLRRLKARRVYAFKRPGTTARLCTLRSGFEPPESVAD